MDFQYGESSYLLPIPANHYLASLSDVQLALQSHEAERGVYCDFYPMTDFTAASRLLPQYQQALFYALTIDTDIRGRTLYYLNFYTNQGEPMTLPPSLCFSCQYLMGNQTIEDMTAFLGYNENQGYNVLLNSMKYLDSQTGNTKAFEASYHAANMFILFGKNVKTKALTGVTSASGGASLVYLESFVGQESTLAMTQNIK
ncbi:hypothetical protein [Providencia manganoxydans]|uniref:hypothetical protein n=1 Tax=Providencia manganoxydans TaxID=2923283 RepID=UPI0032DB3991